MRQALLISVAAVALAAGSTLAYSQGSPSAAPGGGSGEMRATPGGPSGGGADRAPGGASGAGADRAPGGPNGQITETPSPGRGAQDRTIPEKKQSTEQRPASGDQAPQQQGQTRPQQDQKAPQQQGQTAPQQPGAKNAQGAQQPSGSKQGAADRPMRSSNVSLTVEQKTVVRTKVLTSSAPRVTNVNFTINVGTVVPRTVRVAPVPVTLVEIEPTWRGYMYFVHGDEIIIVEPRTLEIVAVLEV